MANVPDPGSLTAYVPTPIGAVVLPVPAANAINDLWRAWYGFQKQTSYVLPRRMARATAFRAQLKRAVAL